MNVMPYQKAEDIIKQQSKIVVAPCICRKERSAEINPARFIGCGLCITMCESSANALVEKEESGKHPIQANTIEQYMNMARERGL